jgi:hypothetical protein
LIGFLALGALVSEDASQPGLGAPHRGCSRAIFPAAQPYAGLREADKIRLVSKWTERPDIRQ